MVRPRVTQPLGRPPGISDVHLMHGGRDGAIRAHGQRPTAIDRERVRANDAVANRL
jgi:hypothetical protein